MSSSRVTWLVAIALVAGTALAFCAGDKEPSAAGESAAGAGSQPGMVGNMYRTGLPIVKEPVTLKVMSRMHAASGDIGKMEFLKQIDRTTNVKIEGDFVPFVQWNEKKNLVLASGDLPDLFIGQGITDSDIVTYSSQGFFVPLDSLVKAWAPNVQRLFQKRPEYEGASRAPDGKLYSIPGVNEIPFRENPEVFFMNKTWLQKLNLKVPTTTDEYYAVLKAFREKDPNGNGKTDEIPLSFAYAGTPDYTKLYALFGAFGIIDGTHHLCILDGKVVFAPAHDRYRKALEYFHKLYSEKLIDPEAFAQNLQQYYAKGKSADILYGSYFDWFGDACVGSDRLVKDYMAIAPLKGPEGHQVWRRVFGYLMKHFFEITPKNKYPEISMRWLDYLYDEKISLQLTRGPLGIVLNENPDGTFSINPAPKGVSDDTFRLQHTPAEAYPWAVLSEVMSRVKFPPSLDRKLNVYYPIYKPYLEKDIYPLVTYTKPESDRLAILQTDIHGYVEQMMAKFVVGDESIEKSWQKYVEQLDKMGLAELLKIRQAAYDRFLKK